jgi:glycosyltransferase involved in cell wall biosynthesis
MQFSTPATISASNGEIRLPRVLYAIVLRTGEKFSSGEEQIALLAQEFQRNGAIFYPLFISDPATSNTLKYESLGIKASCLDLQRFSFRGLRDLISVIDANNIDIVHWNFTTVVANPYLWALSLARPRVRHWYTDHTSKMVPNPPLPSGLRRALKKLLLRRYEQTICVSSYIEQYNRRQGLTDRLTMCAHFINTKRFAPDPEVRAAVRRRELVEDRQVMIYVGHLIADKGIDLAIDALRGLPDSVVFWIIGKGPVAAELEARAKAKGVSGRVRFFGQQVEVQPFMQAADVLVCPSRWAEAAGFVNLEAQACGLPVVGARIGGIPEYVIDGETGLLANPEDVTDLTQKLAEVLTDPARRAKLSASALAHARKNFCPESGMPPMLAVYRGKAPPASNPASQRAESLTGQASSS